MFILVALFVEMKSMSAKNFILIWISFSLS